MMSSSIFIQFRNIIGVISLRSRRIWIVKTGLVEVGDDEEKK